MTKTNTIVTIFVTNLGKYTEGELVGMWLPLPASQEAITEALEKIGINDRYEEYFITDYESDMLEVKEYSNINRLNEQAEMLAELDEYEMEIVEVLLHEGGYTLGEALDKKDDCIVYSDCSDMTDVAMQYVAETGMLDNVPETISRYFDYEALGRDMSFEGQYVFTAHGNCVQIL